MDFHFTTKLTCFFLWLWKGKKPMTTFEEKRREEVTKKSLHALSYVPFLQEEKNRYNKQSRDPPRCWSHYEIGALEGELEYKVRVLKLHRLHHLQHWVACLTRQHVMCYSAFHPPPLEFWVALKKELNGVLVQLVETKGVVEAYGEEVGAKMVVSSVDKRLCDGLGEWVREMDLCVSRLTCKVDSYLKGISHHFAYEVVYSGLPQKVCVDALSKVLGYL